jgi:hypothetical protein
VTFRQLIVLRLIHTFVFLAEFELEKLPNEHSVQTTLSGL